MNQEFAEETWRVSDEARGSRLDAYVAEYLGVPRNQVQRWISDRLLAVDGIARKPSFYLSGGEVIDLTRPLKTESRIEPEDGPLDILHEDDEIVVVNKPTGLAVHPGAGRRRGTLAHRLLHHYPETGGVGGEGRPGIVHRLDLGTTGVMVVARTEAAYLALSQAFQERRVEKTYLGLCEGHPGLAADTMTWPIARHPTRRKEMRTDSRGRPARSDYRVLATARRSALLRLAIHTGRTHQIRVHLKALGHPLLGDETYGRAIPRDWPQTLQAAVAELKRPALHAWKLAIPHPTDARQVEFLAPIPADLERLWSDLKGKPALGSIVASS